jgi:cytoskeletal protein CcmA (bactofilin family)
MALASPFFGKREPEPVASPFSGNNGRNLTGTVRTEPTTSSPTSTNAQTSTQTGLRADAHTSSTQQAGNMPEGSRLIVGPNIKLKGVEITDCDTLVVEGTVEATMDSRVIQIMANGAFKGSADIDIAEIHGQFDGNLTVRDKLVIYAQGKVNGTIRYGKVIIEEGGQLSGDVQFGAKSGTASKPVTNLMSAQSAPAQKMGIHVAQ